MRFRSTFTSGSGSLLLTTALIALLASSAPRPIFKSTAPALSTMDVMALPAPAVEQAAPTEPEAHRSSYSVAPALIHDEYGHFEGIVTPADLLAAIAGEFASDADPDDAPSVVEREDGSLLVAGQMAVDALAERLGIDLPEDRDYATVAGLALAVFRHLPGEGESFVEQGWKFEVVDLDGRRIDKLLVRRALKRE